MQHPRDMCAAEIQLARWTDYSPTESLGILRLRKQKTRTRRVFCLQQSEKKYQRLENCLARRAPRRPTFFRSTSRASRVTKPALESAGLRVAS